MPQKFTNTRAGMITIAHVEFLPGDTKEIPSAETLAKWQAEHDAHKADPRPASEKGNGPGKPEDREAKLLAQVEASSVYKAKHLVKGQVTLPEPPARPAGAVMVASNKPSSLAEFDITRATALVRLETSLEILAGWSSKENRTEVLDTIKARAEYLSTKV